MDPSDVQINLGPADEVIHHLFGQTISNSARSHLTQSRIGDGRFLRTDNLLFLRISHWDLHSPTRHLKLQLLESIR